MRSIHSAVPRRRLLVGGIASAALIALMGLLATAPVRAASIPAFEPVVLKRVALPKGLIGYGPVFSADGRHLLFNGNASLYVVGTDGKGLTCLTCGRVDVPVDSENNSLITPFADGRRVFMGALNNYGGGPREAAILECTPSVLNCATKQVLPVDPSGARPPLTAGGPSLTPPINTANTGAPTIAPDGKHIAFSDVRTDASELMVVARLTRTPTQYVTSDPKVLNPKGPTSTTDTDTRAWSDSAAIYEFKTFANGGADALYIQAGGAAAGNPDIWQVNLASGKRTRLTSDAEWDQDSALSPNGRSLVNMSTRTMHVIADQGSLLPVRGFIDAPILTSSVGYFIDDSFIRAQCQPQPWLLPSTGDRDAGLLGQPLDPYTGGSTYGSDNFNGYPIWNPQSTQIALSNYTATRQADKLEGTPFLTIARLSSRRASKPHTIVSSDVGAWAPAPQDYHGAIQTVDHIVLKGLASGTATVDDDDPDGLLGGVETVTYDKYSDNGRDFVSGTVSWSSPSILDGPNRYQSHLRMTGAHTGHTEIDVTYSGLSASPHTVSGTSVTNYDGTTRRGPLHLGTNCRSRLPRAPQLKAGARTVTRDGKTYLRVSVTATISGAGLNQKGSDTRAVRHATVTLGTERATTGANGIALLRVPARAGRLTLTATAGDTFLAAKRRWPPA